MNEWKVGQLIIYRNGDRFEVGRIKSLNDRGAFVFYHSGETAALTPYDLLIKITNEYCITGTTLGGEDGKKVECIKCRDWKSGENWCPGEEG